MGLGIDPAIQERALGWGIKSFSARVNALTTESHWPEQRTFDFYTAYTVVFVVKYKLDFPHRVYMNGKDN